MYVCGVCVTVGELVGSVVLYTMSMFLMMGGTVYTHSYPAYTVMESHEWLYAQSVSPLFAVEFRV